ncbi:MAG: trigger factor [Bacteroidetes bacterium GWC2_33_15]|nr:MAG: trigger factor [Bacteroidetes bacterium GWA2_33_15]OFX52622.1 MAG: trigger factor [Bacteroidetes bacterium GWC2_33_15]OFX63967.1 MAG: trigger factor [Bacteroidetes bacterium GWB2_32_14]OFX70858.1 MAG: trigger factor [Bacteroidetes bacterium GWD2_33_33]HAN19982.1 trigger factor [Bacteroidales bacterium]
MNITKENINNVNALLKVNVTKDDYTEKVETQIKEYKKKARIDGFRPGKIPEGLVRKMYGKAILVDEVNKIMSDSLTKYLIDEKLNILGEPLPSREHQKTINFDTDTEFEFVFDIALAPQIEINLSKKDKIPFYDIKVDDKILDSQIDNYSRRFGEFKDVEEATTMEMLTGNFIQLDENNAPVEAGISTEQVKITIEYIKDTEIKNLFAGKKVGDKVIFDLRKAYPSDTEISSMLRIDKEKAKELTGNFEFAINQIQRFEKAEINQELFDKAFGEGTIKSEKEFKEKLIAEVKENFIKESDYRFMFDAKDKLVSKINPELPSEFLKRWLLEINKGKFTAEQIELEYPVFEEDLKWQLIKDQIIRNQDIKVDEQEVLSLAKEVTAAQFMQYGLNNLPDEHLENYAKEILKKDSERKKLYEKKLEDKVVAFVKDSVKLDTKEITTDEFQKLWSEQKSK